MEDSTPVEIELTPISEEIRARVEAAGARYFANDNIGDFVEPWEIELLVDEVEGKVAALLDSLVIDQENDHNSNGTARRVARMFVTEVFAGRYADPPDVTDFPNVTQLDQLYVVGPIEIRSACSHHLVPIMGEAWIGIMPGDRVVGLSKFARMAQWVMARPQIQEEATTQLADLIEERCEPIGLAVVVKAKHLCCGWRGVKDRSSMSTSVMRGVLREDAAARAEFLSLIAGHGFECK